MTEASIIRRELLGVLARYQMPTLRGSLGQIATTFLPFFALMAAMYVAAGHSAWAGFVLAVPAAGFIVRIFIIQHDCGHGAFFRSRAANDWMGRICSVITLTPYANWRRQHANHHAVWNNLDRRSEGADIYSTCLTVREYSALSGTRRWLYRALRHPLVAQVLLPPFVFMVLYRLPFDTPRTWRRERNSVWWTNAALAALALGLILLLGAGPVLLVQLPTMAIASIIGVWIFSVQHRFEQVLWTRQASWSATSAALYGSSHLKLPRMLQWFSGNIGFHHIHHLVPRVPNYRLEECHRACAGWSGHVTSLTLWQALRAPAFLLWDEDRGHMIRLVDIGT
ncbi:MAG: fatty acid desaturase [Alphaproteobacteria bacterium]|nr:fatty acid desaturase [Alphaproteobacteria bacterium]